MSSGKMVGWLVLVCDLSSPFMILAMMILTSFEALAGTWVVFRRTMYLLQDFDDSQIRRHLIREPVRKCFHHLLELEMFMIDFRTNRNNAWELKGQRSNRTQRHVRPVDMLTETR